ncbi:hypothetical protein D3C87_2120990 [compost metagenome]
MLKVAASAGLPPVRHIEPRRHLKRGQRPAAFLVLDTVHAGGGAEREDLKYRLERLLLQPSKQVSRALV